MTLMVLRSDKPDDMWYENGAPHRATCRYCCADLETVTRELERLRTHLKKGQGLVNAMDEQMPEQATEDADGWINSYRIPVGPWHRLLGWARGGLPSR